MSLAYFYGVTIWPQLEVLAVEVALIPFTCQHELRYYLDVDLVDPAVKLLLVTTSLDQELPLIFFQLREGKLLFLVWSLKVDMNLYPNRCFHGSRVQLIVTYNLHLLHLCFRVFS